MRDLIDALFIVLGILGVLSTLMLYACMRVNGRISEEERKRFNDPTL